MTLMMRIARLFKADMHVLLDLLEEPEAVLKQAIRDMETEIEAGKSTLDERRQKEAGLRRTAGDLESSIAAYTEQIDIAFEAQNDDLARTLIRKKLEAENRLQTTTRVIDVLTAEAEAMQNQLHDQQAQLDAIVAQMPLCTDAASRAEPPASGAAPLGVAEEDVEVAFLREKRKRTEGRE